MNKLYTMLISFALVFSLNINAAQAEVYEVTITNLTRGQVFSSVFAFTHNRKEKLFSVGQAASAELAALAQDADNSGLNSFYTASSNVAEVIEGAGNIPPGKSETITIKARGNKRFLSLASMLVTTNDAFLAVNKIKLPYLYRKTIAPAYDAGAEANDEACAYIPGPPCGNPNSASDVDGEGYVHIHAGIHGIEDLNAAQYDWRNPVAEITIKRIWPHL